MNLRLSDSALTWDDIPMSPETIDAVERIWLHHSAGPGGLSPHGGRLVLDSPVAAARLVLGETA